MTLRAKDLMQTKVECVDPELPLAELERAFLAARVTGFPVVRGGKLVGVVSRSDIVRKLATEQSYAEYVSEFHRDIGETEADDAARFGTEIATHAAARLATSKVSDVMSHTPVTVEPDTLLSDVARVLVEKRIHRVLVASGGKLAGILTSFDLVRLIADKGAPEA